MSAEIKQYLEHLAEWQAEHFPKEDTPPQFILRHGRSFAFDNASFTEEGEEKMCYRNAAEGALWNPDVTYVEGYIGAVIPLEHAWLIDQHGKVIDPTIRNTGHIYGYFGVPFQHDFLRKCLLKNKRYGIFHWQHHDWKKAKPEQMIAMMKEAA